MQHNKTVLFMLTSLLCAHNTTHSYAPTSTQRDGLLVAAGAAAATAVGVLVAGYTYSKLRLDHNKLRLDHDELDKQVNAKDGLKTQLKKLKEERTNEPSKINTNLLQNQKTLNETLQLVAGLQEIIKKRDDRLAALESANKKEVKEKEHQALLAHIDGLIATAKENLTKDHTNITTLAAAGKGLAETLKPRVDEFDGRIKSLEKDKANLLKSSKKAAEEELGKLTKQFGDLKKEFSVTSNKVNNDVNNSPLMKKLDGLYKEIDALKAQLYKHTAENTTVAADAPAHAAAAAQPNAAAPEAQAAAAVPAASLAASTANA